MIIIYGIVVPVNDFKTSTEWWMTLLLIDQLFRVWSIRSTEHVILMSASPSKSKPLETFKCEERRMCIL